MTQYLYPQNLKATANLWLWGLRDFCILGIAALLSIVALVQLRIVLCFGKSSSGWRLTSSTGISPPVGSLPAALIGCDGFITLDL